MENKTIGILGGGFVGQVMKKYYKDAKMYDINITLDTKEEVLQCDIIFVVFNLLDNGRTTTEPIEEYCREAPDDRIFIIKSTFVPGTTDALQAKYPQHRFIYNPEFLTELTAWHDFTTPHIQILGVPHEALKLVHDIFKILPKAPQYLVVSPKDAELIKHATNSYYATKVAFFNQLHDACEEVGADYDTVAKTLALDIRIGDSHNIIFHNGYRGFGGKCLPKDVEALRKVTNFPLLDYILDYNDGLRSK